MELLSLLNHHDVTELGFLDPLHPEEMAFLFLNGIRWIRDSNPYRPRTLWFRSHSDRPGLEMLPRNLLSRFIAMDAKKHAAWVQMGPFQAVATRKGSPPPSERELYWTQNYAQFGALEQIPTSNPAWDLWAWKAVPSAWNGKRAFCICHHNAVLPDVRNQLWIHGIKADFAWVPNHTMPIGDAWPSAEPPFEENPLPTRSLDIPLPQAYIEHLRSTYDMIVTSHCARYTTFFFETGLPIVHINSTRFAGDLVTKPAEFEVLCNHLEAAVAAKQLHIVSNNRADDWYIRHYLDISGIPVIPNICQSPLLFRIEPPSVSKHLLWDTRYHVNNTNVLNKIACALGSRIEVYSYLAKYLGGYETHETSKYTMEDDFLKPFSSVIHIPYNVSTMSLAEQSSANIPVWIPSKSFLKQLFESKQEYSELSWYAFVSETEQLTAKPPDRFREPDTVNEFLERSDFEAWRMQNVHTFDSIEDLVKKLDAGPDYTDTIWKSFFHTLELKHRVAGLWRGQLTKIWPSK